MIADMKEFSIHFASEIKLCTMCEHRLCPISSFEVLFRCRECSHEGYEEYGVTQNEDGEKWCVCRRYLKEESVGVEGIEGLH